MQRSFSVFDSGVNYLTNAIVDLASQSMNPDPALTTKIEHKATDCGERTIGWIWPIVPCGSVDEDSDYYSATR